MWVCAWVCICWVRDDGELEHLGWRWGLNPWSTTGTMGVVVGWRGWAKARSSI